MTNLTQTTTVILNRDAEGRVRDFIPSTLRIYGCRERLVELYVVKLSNPDDEESPLKRYYISVPLWKLARELRKKNVNYPGHLWIHAVFTLWGHVVVAEWDCGLKSLNTHEIIRQPGWHCSHKLVDWKYDPKSEKR